MEQRLSIITLGVDNLEAMKKFYTEKFGWVIEAQAKDIAFFKLNGLLFGLYGRKDLAAFNSKEEVQGIYKDFLKRGIKIIKAPQEPPFGGYYFLATDPEENVWEVSLNPFMQLDEKGNVLSHQNIDNL
jgi:predicted enzyme related to lactoylglutathione lyase